MHSLLGAYSKIAMVQGMAYGGISCLNSFGLLQNVTPLGAATGSALLATTHDLFDLTRKQISSLNWIQDLYNKEEQIEDQLSDKTLKDDKKAELVNRRLEISNELKPYRWLRSITSCVITYFTQHAATHLVNKALHSAVTYLPAYMLQMHYEISISPTAVISAIIYATGTLIFVYQQMALRAAKNKQNNPLLTHKKQFVKEHKEELKKLSSKDIQKINDKAFGFIKKLPILAFTLSYFGAMYGSISFINRVDPVDILDPIKFATCSSQFMVSAELLNVVGRQFSLFKWIDKLPAELELINKKLKNYEGISLDKNKTIEFHWLTKRKREITEKIKNYNAITAIAAAALTYFSCHMTSSLVHSALEFAVTCLPSRFALRACSTLSITPMSLVVATLAIAGLLLVRLPNEDPAPNN